MSHRGWCPCEPTAACPPLLWGDDAVQHFLKQGRNAENWSSVVFVGVQVVMVTVPAGTGDTLIAPLYATIHSPLQYSGGM